MDQTAYTDIQRLGGTLCALRGAQLPRDDTAGVIVEHRIQVNPAPFKYFELGKICLRHLLGPHGRCVEAIKSLDHHMGAAGD